MIVLHSHRKPKNGHKLNLFRASARKYGNPSNAGALSFAIPEAVALLKPGTQGSGPIFFGQV
jgi:hypothetical protein